mmetsp:Transcript_4028/g.7067  ORF Transcript_4028/g.7067 Transcript_4028/m.7067 type:complete len:306 (+) Transcript_4028:78-995(+)
MWSAGRQLCARALSSASSPQLGLGRPVVKGTVSAALGVPDAIPAPPYAGTGDDPLSGQTYSLIDPKSEEFTRMRDACAHARETLEYAGSLVEPGVTTDYIDRKVHEHTLARGIYPSPYGYRHFPKSLCSSVNEVMCHGIPDDRELEEGDIVNLDVSCYVGGYHGDTSKTFKVGNVSEKASRLTDVTEQCLADCIALVGPGVPLRNVGELVAQTCEKHGYDTSRTFCGHGIGSTFHMLPYVLHFRNADDLVLAPNMVFTIEPILCEGSQDHVLWEDGWTVATKDGGLSAQFEHTIIITDHGAEILT